MTAQNWISIAAIISAVVAYFAKNFILEPHLEFRRVKGKIQNRLKYHSNIITNGEFPADVIRPIHQELRRLSCDLEERYYSIAFVDRLFRILRVPKPKDLSDIARRLIFLSNTTGSSRHIDHNIDAINEIKTKLRLVITE